MSSAQRYCLDTSALIEAWQRSYAIDVFPLFWELLEEGIENGVFVCPDEVLHELYKKEDGLFAWVKAHEKLVVPIDDALQLSVGEVLTRFPTLVDSRKNRSQADPFVIGLARIQRRTVVTGEKAAGNGKVPKIPNVCAHFNVATCSLLQMIRNLGWRFGR